MSNVKNEPKYKNGILQAIRAQLEHRAFWLYLLCDEAKKRGLDPRDFASDAVKRCGLSQGAELVKKGRTDSLKGLRKTLFTKPAQLVFEMKIIESTDDKLSIDFHYCPLVKAWQNAGCSDEEIAMLCGFESEYYFYSFFKRGTGKTPLAWRRMMQVTIKT